MSDATCMTCPFWAEYPAGDGDEVFPTSMGDCRRHAPTLIAAQAEDPRDLVDFHSLFPYTVSDQWCGEHPDGKAALKARKADAEATEAGYRAVREFDRARAEAAEREAERQAEEDVEREAEHQAGEEEGAQ